MGKISLLDCTLRDGGYLNDWLFGEDAIRHFGQLIAQTGTEYYEIGFIKPCEESCDRTVFPDVYSASRMVQPRHAGLSCVAMIDMSDPVDKSAIPPRTKETLDGIRVIFKEGRQDLGYEYAEHCIAMGYETFIQFVGTDTYTDEVLRDAVIRFSALKPFAMSVVDSFGMIRRRDFLRMISIMDENMDPETVLGYHSHNNLQLAMGNAQAFAEMGLERDILIDASVFGMGRGAGNLNLELFAQYLNEEHGKHYRIEPMLEIMDRYLSDIYETKFWGYSLPLYMSAANGVHPNYAIYLAKKNTLSQKSFNEILKNIPEPDGHNFSKEKAEKYYSEYMEKFIDDSADKAKLAAEFNGRKVLVVAPGATLNKCADEIEEFIETEDPVIVSLNFVPVIKYVDQSGGIKKSGINEVILNIPGCQAEYVFSSNMRRYSKIQDAEGIKKIITSNIRDAVTYDYMLNFSSYISQDSEIIDNSGVMFLKVLMSMGIREVWIAGMDGYIRGDRPDNYFNLAFESEFPDLEERNVLIGKQLSEINRHMKLRLLTPTKYLPDSAEDFS